MSFLSRYIASSLGYTGTGTAFSSYQGPGLAQPDGGILSAAHPITRKGAQALEKYLLSMTHARRFKLAQTAKNKEGLYGIMVITPTRRVVPVLAGVAAKSAGEDIILGTASNWAGKPKFVKASADAFKDVLFLREAAWFAESGLDNANINLGKAFTKATATAEFADLVPFCTKQDDTTEYCVAAFPASFLLGGNTIAPTGNKVDTIMGQAEDIGEEATGWMEAVLSFDKPAHAACVASADKMGAHLPKLPRGVVYGDSAFVKVTKLSDDEEEELAVPIREVHKACAEAAALNNKTAAGKQANQAPHPQDRYSKGSAG